jgi:hypothetical protein
MTPLSGFNLNSPKMWPPNSAHPTTASNYSLMPYETDTRLFPGSQTFGHPQHSTSLKQHIYRNTGALPPSPKISSRPCSRSEAIEGAQGALASTSSAPAPASAPAASAAPSSGRRNFAESYFSTSGGGGGGGGRGKKKKGSTEKESDRRGKQKHEGESMGHESGQGGQGGSGGLEGYSLHSQSQSLQSQKVANSLSALQQTLVQCGRLNLAEVGTYAHKHIST